MENLFVRILNSSLVVFAFVCLAIAGIALAFVLIAAPGAFFSDTASRPIAVAYKAGGGGAGAAKDAAPAEDPALAAAAKASCDASNALYEFMSDKKLSLADPGKCPADDADQAKQQFGDRAVNYLNARADYIKALIADGNPHKKFPMQDDADVGTQGSQYFNDTEAKFAAEFNAGVAADEARKAKAEIVSVESKGAEIVYGCIAAMAFFTFLVAGFLFTAARIERHVGGIAGAGRS